MGINAGICVQGARTSGSNEDNEVQEVSIEDTEKLTALYINTNSLVNKREYLRRFLIDTEEMSQIIAITEVENETRSG